MIRLPSLISRRWILLEENHAKPSKFLANCFSNVSRPIILGIESSCDDTGAAVVDGRGRVLGESLRSQQSFSSRFGGVIPAFAQKMHEANVEPVVEEAMTNSGLTYEELDAVAVTTKPGLVLCLKVGVQHALKLCKAYRKPLVPIHHMQAHALTIRMLDQGNSQQQPSVEYPFVCLLISGGHCILTWVKSVDEFLILGEDTDGAPGEAFDKVARRLRLRHLKPEYNGLSGGVLIERIAREGGGDPLSIKLPIPSSGGGGNSMCDFSFSGIKTFVLCSVERWEKEQGLASGGFLSNLPDVCASFQHAICVHTGRRIERALVFLRHNKLLPEGFESRVVISGGVASNSYLRTGLAYLAAHYDCRLVSPPPKLCTDNGIMIAWNGVERFRAGVGIVASENVPDTLWVDGTYPIGPKIAAAEIKEAHRGTSGHKTTKLSYNFYDPSHLETALNYSNARLQRITNVKKTIE